MTETRRGFVRGLSALVFLAAAVSAYGGNLVRNAGFESEGLKSGAEHWSSADKTYSYVSGGGRNGTRAVAFDVREGSPYMFPSQILDLKPGEAYRAETWVRTENVTGNGATFAVEWSLTNGAWGGGAYASVVKGTKGFTKLVTVARIPRNAGRVTISPYLHQGTCGKAWFDDFSVTVAERNLLGEIVSDAYRNTIVNGDIWISTVVEMPAAERAAKGVRGRYEYALGNGTRRSQEVEIDKGAARICIDVGELANGKTTVRFVLAAADGRELASRELSVNRPFGAARHGTLALLPKRPVAIERTRTLVDGEPFFPLGIFVSTLTDGTIADIRKGAFNCVMSYGPPTRAQLDAAHRAGLKVIYSIKDAYLGTRGCPGEIVDEESEYAWVTNRVLSFRDHPALLAWYINDELGVEYKDRLAARRKLVSELDSGHPTYVALYQMDVLREYLNTFDVIGSDPYPICQTGDPPISQVAEHTRITRETVFGGMAMWQIPQIFDWGGYRKEDVAKTRAPTFDEMRNMAWQFVAEGAMGLVPYAYHSLKKMDWRDRFEVQWKKVCDISREMKRWTPVFLSEEPSVPVIHAPEGVSVRTWRFKGCDYVLCVNTTRKPVSSALELGVYGRVDVDLPPIGVEMKKLMLPPFPRAKEGYLVAAEQRSCSVVVFDGRTPGPKPYVWEWNAARDPNVAKADVPMFGYTAECKILSGEDCDSVIMVGSSGGFAEISLKECRAIAYGKVDLSPHSIARLPGTLTYVIASAISNCLTVVDCSDAPFVPEKQKCRKFTLPDAHGVEWDVRRNCLWALGSDKLVRYAWNAASYELKPMSEYPLALANDKGGHDLAPDGNGNYLLTGSREIHRFYPEEGRFETLRAVKQVKSVSPSSVYGTALIKVRQTWWSDRVLVRGTDGEYAVGPFPGAKFYKARWMK